MECGISLAVQWFRLCASTAGGAGSISGWGTQIPHAAGHGHKQKKRGMDCLIVSGTVLGAKGAKMDIRYILLL